MAEDPIEEDVRRILDDSYGLVPKSVKETTGFYCKNFIISMDEKVPTSEPRKKFIVKIYCDDEEHQMVSENLDLQHVMQRHLAADGIIASQPIATKQGQTVVKYRKGNKEYLAQVLTFLHGIDLVEAALTKNDMQTLAPKIGKFTAEIHKSLMALQYDTSKFTGSNEFRPESALEFRPRLQYVKEENVKSLIEEHFHLYEKNVLPRLKSLRRILAHSDISNGNIIVRKANEWEIVGLIDFEDSYLGFVVGDLGICLAYMLMQTGFITGSDVVDISTRAIRAYEEIFPLESDEKDVLYEMITSRIVVSYLCGCEKVHFDPENSKLWLRQSLHAPDILRKIREVDRQTLESTWFRQSSGDAAA